MKKLQFSIEIHASPASVWEAMWSDTGYRRWTEVFAEGSYAVTEGWKQGSKVQFLMPGGDGMYSLVAEHIPNERMSFKHLGPVKKGVEMPPESAPGNWTGALEKYRLVAQGELLTLHVELDAEEAYVEFFEENFPKALERIRMLAEG